MTQAQLASTSVDDDSREAAKTLQMIEPLREVFAVPAVLVDAGQLPVQVGRPPELLTGIRPTSDSAAMTKRILGASLPPSA